MNRSPLSKLALGAFAAVFLMAYGAAAEPPPPVDVVVRENPPPRRVFAIEYNPLSLVIGKVSGNVVVVPIDHHGLVLTPFYVSTTTVPINRVLDPAGMSVEQLPKQKFEGFGGEIGYRYYSGLGGPRGFFAGPSLAVAWITATASNLTQTSFVDYVLAGDVGYAALVADRVAITLGVGAQYTFTSKTIPNQQPPANIYANSAFEPRVLAALGCAF
jgi:hypothetical protein